MQHIKVLFFILLPVFLFGQQPNIIYIMSDDQGYAEIGSNDSDWHTPHIDSLRAKGAYFNQFYVQPSCTPTRAAFHSGIYPHKLGMWADNIGTGEDASLPDSIFTLPERLKDEGYATALVGKWHQGHAYPEDLPNARGYDYHYGGYHGQWNFTAPFAQSATGDYDQHLNGEIDYNETDYYTEVLGQKAVDWINQQGTCSNTPFFLHVSFSAPHSPLQAPADTISLAPAGFSADKKTRWAMIRIMDNEIGKIWDAVIDNGLESNTVIIFTTDNGGDIQNFAADNSPFQLGKRYLAEGGIRVPFIWYQSGTVSRGTTIDTACHIVDLLPTFISLAGGQIANADTSKLDGVDISPLTTGSSIAERYIINHIVPDRTWAVVKGKWKLVNNKDETAKDDGNLADNIELFDVRSDQGEVTDVSGTYPAIVTELQAVIDAALLEVAPSFINATSGSPTGLINSEVGTTKTFYSPSYQFYRNPGN